LSRRRPLVPWVDCALAVDTDRCLSLVACTTRVNEKTIDRDRATLAAGTNVPAEMDAEAEDAETAGTNVPTAPERRSGSASLVSARRSSGVMELPSSLASTHS
jgi:hypothetical protein